MLSISKIDICARALSLVGGNMINSLEEDSNEAEYCRRNYDDLRLALLRQYPYNFALRQAQLPRLDKEVLNYSFAYALPLDCLRVKTVNSDTWQVAGSELYCNAESVIIEYVRDVSEAGEFDALFAEALVYKLASVLTVCISSDAEKSQLFENKCMNTLRAAQRIDASERSAETARNSFLDARRR